MSFVNLDVTGAQEPQVVEENTYTHRIASAEQKDGKKPGAKNIEVITEIEGAGPNVPPVFTYLSLPNASDDDKASRFKVLQLKRFMHAFDIPYDTEGFNLSDWLGCTGEVLTKVDEYEGNLKNVIQIPRLPHETTGG